MKYSRRRDMMRRMMVLLLVVVVSAWKTTQAQIIIGGAEADGSFVVCGEDATKACPECCDEKGNCKFGNIDTSVICLDGGGIDCARLCAAGVPATPKPTVLPDVPSTDKGESENDDELILCGVDIVEACPLCCDKDGCLFAEVYSQVCPDPNAVNCKQYCPIPYEDVSEEDAIGSVASTATEDTAEEEEEEDMEMTEKPLTEKEENNSKEELVICGVDIVEACPLCCDKDGCLFAEVYAQVCPDPNAVNCKRYCPIPYQDIPAEDAIGSVSGSNGVESETSVPATKSPETKLPSSETVTPAPETTAPAPGPEAATSAPESTAPAPQANETSSETTTSLPGNETEIETENEGEQIQPGEVTVEPSSLEDDGSNGILGLQSVSFLIAVTFMLSGMIFV